MVGIGKIWSPADGAGVVEGMISCVGICILYAGVDAALDDFRAGELRKQRLALSLQEVAA